MSSSPICSICCDHFKASTTVQTTQCGHLFHDNCIKRWLTNNTTCPECRRSRLTLTRAYLNFVEVAEDNESNIKLNEINQDQIESLTIRLSLEEEKYKNAEKCLQDLEQNKCQLERKLRDEKNELLTTISEEQKRRQKAEKMESDLQKQLDDLNKKIVSNADTEQQIENLTIRLSMEEEKFKNIKEKLLAIEKERDADVEKFHTLEAKYCSLLQMREEEHVNHRPKMEHIRNGLRNETKTTKYVKQSASLSTSETKISGKGNISLKLRTSVSSKKSSDGKKVNQYNATSSSNTHCLYHHVHHCASNLNFLSLSDFK